MKKNTILLVLMCISAFVNAQNNNKKVTISGHLDGVKQNHIFISLNGKKDTVAIKNGNFSHQVQVSKPTRAYISYAPGKGRRFCIDGEPVKVNGSFEFIQDIVITGGETQRKLNVLDKKLNVFKKMEAEADSIYDIAIKTNDRVVMKSIAKKESAAKQGIIRVTEDFIAKNPKSIICLDKLIDIMYNLDYEDLNRLYLLTDSSLQASSDGKFLVKFISMLQKGSMGQQMLDFTQNDPEGKPVQFSSFKGKYVLIDFWASWCGPCRAENPVVVAAYHKYAAKGFTVIGVSLDSEAESWKKAIKDDGLSWAHVSDLKGFRNAVANYYGIFAIPSNYLVNPEGVIIARNLRGQHLEDKLEELFK